MFKTLKGIHSSDKQSYLNTRVHLVQQQMVVYSRFYVVPESSQRWTQTHKSRQITQFPIYNTSEEIIVTHACEADEAEASPTYKGNHGSTKYKVSYI